MSRDRVYTSPHWIRKRKQPSCTSSQGRDDEHEDRRPIQQRRLSRSVHSRRTMGDLTESTGPRYSAASRSPGHIRTRLNNRSRPVPTNINSGSRRRQDSDLNLDQLILSFQVQLSAGANAQPIRLHFHRNWRPSLPPVSLHFQNDQRMALGWERPSKRGLDDEDNVETNTPKRRRFPATHPYRQDALSGDEDTEARSEALPTFDEIIQDEQSQTRETRDFASQHTDPRSPELICSPFSEIESPPPAPFRDDRTRTWVVDYGVIPIFPDGELCVDLESAHGTEFESLQIENENKHEDGDGDEDDEPFENSYEAPNVGAPIRSIFRFFALILFFYSVFFFAFFSLSPPTVVSHEALDWFDRILQAEYAYASVPRVLLFGSSEDDDMSCRHPGSLVRNGTPPDDLDAGYRHLKNQYERGPFETFEPVFSDKSSAWLSCRPKWLQTPASTYVPDVAFLGDILKIMPQVCSDLTWLADHGPSAFRFTQSLEGQSHASTQFRWSTLGDKFLPPHVTLPVLLSSTELGQLLDSHGVPTARPLAPSLARGLDPPLLALCESAKTRAENAWSLGDMLNTTVSRGSWWSSQETAAYWFLYAITSLHQQQEAKVRRHFMLHASDDAISWTSFYSTGEDEDLQGDAQATPELDSDLGRLLFLAASRRLESPQDARSSTASPSQLHSHASPSSTREPRANKPSDLDGIPQEFINSWAAFMAAQTGISQSASTSQPSQTHITPPRWDPNELPTPQEFSKRQLRNQTAQRLLEGIRNTFLHFPVLPATDTERTGSWTRDPDNDPVSDSRQENSQLVKRYAEALAGLISSVSNLRDRVDQVTQLLPNPGILGASETDRRVQRLHDVRPFIDEVALPRLRDMQTRSSEAVSLLEHAAAVHQDIAGHVDEWYFMGSGDHLDPQPAEDHVDDSIPPPWTTTITPPSSQRGDSHPMTKLFYLPSLTELGLTTMFFRVWAASEARDVGTHHASDGADFYLKRNEARNKVFKEWRRHVKNSHEGQDAGSWWNWSFRAAPWSKSERSFPDANKTDWQTLNLWQMVIWSRWSAADSRKDTFCCERWQLGSDAGTRRHQKMGTETWLSLDQVCCEDSHLQRDPDASARQGPDSWLFWDGSQRHTFVGKQEAEERGKA